MKLNALRHQYTVVLLQYYKRKSKPLLTKHKAETSQSEATIYIHATQRNLKQDIVH